MQTPPDPNRESTATPLFPQDTGTLPVGARRALVHLLHGPSLEKERHPQLWLDLITYRDDVSSRLSELFLELVLDQDLGIAFTRRIEAPGEEFPLLLRRVPLTFIDSVLIVHLRQQLARAQAAGDRCAVARDDLIQHLTLYDRTGNTDVAGFKKRANRAVEKMVGHSLLHKIRGTEDRYEVAATLKLLFPAETVAVLTEQYRKIASGELATGAPGDEDGEGA